MPPKQVAPASRTTAQTSATPPPTGPSRCARDAMCASTATKASVASACPCAAIQDSVPPFVAQVPHSVATSAATSASPLARRTTPNTAATITRWTASAAQKYGRGSIPAIAQVRAMARLRTT
jgi:hypothetical protein